MSREKIKKLFDDLSAEEQRLILVELSNSKKRLDIDTNEISKFAARHQKEYQKDISFDVKSENGLITVTMQTVFGKFKGVGNNQKVAKIKAVKLANEAWD